MTTPCPRCNGTGSITEPTPPERNPEAFCAAYHAYKMRHAPDVEPLWSDYGLTAREGETLARHIQCEIDRELIGRTQRLAEERELARMRVRDGGTI